MFFRKSYVRAILVSLISAPAILPSNAKSQDMDINEKITASMSLIKLGCGTGSSKVEFDTSAGADGSLTIRKLPGVEGSASFKYNKKEAEGLAASLKNEVDNNSYKLSEKQIDCMRPLVTKIIDYLFQIDKPEIKSKSDANTSLPKHARGTDNETKKPEQVDEKKHPKIVRAPQDANKHLASVNKALKLKFGFRIGDVYHKSNIAAQQVRFHNDIIQGDFNKFSLKKRNAPEKKLTIWTDSDFIIQAIEFNNYNKDDYDSGKSIGEYKTLIESWGDNTPINTSVIYSIQPNEYSRYHKDSFQSNIRKLGGIRYTYTCEREYDQHGTVTARSRMIFFLAEIGVRPIIQ